MITYSISVDAAFEIIDTFYESSVSSFLSELIAFSCINHKNLIVRMFWENNLNLLIWSSLLAVYGLIMKQHLIFSCAKQLQNIFTLHTMHQLEHIKPTYIQIIVHKSMKRKYFASKEYCIICFWSQEL